MVDPRDEYQKLPEAITRALSQLENQIPGSEEYGEVVDQLTKLTKISQTVADMTRSLFEATTKAEEVENNFALRRRELDQKLMELQKPDRVSKDTLAIIGANLVGIGLILSYEHVHVVASKALGFILRAR